MKKKMVLLLAVFICISLCACGGSVDNSSGDGTDKTTNDVNNTSEQIEEQEIRIEQEDNILVVYLSKKQFSDRLKKITLTKENWFEYFGDYERIEHRVETNDFGDIEKEFDIVQRGFGLKTDIVAFFEKASFKFAGVTVIETDDEKHIYEIGKDTYKSYDKNGEFVGETECENREYYLVELTFPYYVAQNHWFEEYECIDVVGEIIILDLQFNEQSKEQNYTDIQFRFTDVKEVVSLIDLYNYSFLESLIDE